MSIAVPIILAIALAASLYGQAGVTWPNYPAEQNEQSAKGDEKSSEKSKPEQKDTSEKSGKSSKAAATSKARGDARPKRQE